MSWLLILAALLLALIGLPLINDYRFRRMVHQEVRQLFNDMQPQRIRTLTNADWADLPEPVRVYLNRTLKKEQPNIDCVRLKQNGTIRTSPDGKWMPFTAEQYFTTHPPGFIWYAKAKMLPFLWLVARDKYMAQQGAMLIRLMSTINVANARDTATTSSSFMRYIAELMWIPTALIESEYLRWEPIDEKSARAIANDAGVEVTLVFHFNGDGDLESVSAKRYRDASDAEPTNWYGLVKSFGEFNGVRIPSEVEVGWEPDSGYFAYWRGTIIEMETNILRPYSSQSVRPV